MPAKLNSFKMGYLFLTSNWKWMRIYWIWLNYVQQEIFPKMAKQVFKLFYSEKIKLSSQIKERWWFLILFHTIYLVLCSWFEIIIFFSVFPRHFQLGAAPRDFPRPALSFDRPVIILLHPALNKLSQSNRLLSLPF